LRLLASPIRSWSAMNWRSLPAMAASRRLSW